MDKSKIEDIKMEKREFEVDESLLKNYANCIVCREDFKLKEKIVLCPIQEPVKGYASVMSIPIHTNCYWVTE